MNRGARLPKRRGGGNGQTITCQRRAYRPTYRAGDRGSAGRGRAGAVARSACRSAAATSTDYGHRFPGPCLRGKYAEAPLVQGAELARSRHRRRDGGGNGQGRRRRRDLHLPIFNVPITTAAMRWRCNGPTPIGSRWSSRSTPTTRRSPMSSPTGRKRQARSASASSSPRRRTAHRKILGAAHH
jgi:hypothetical protein